MWSRFLYLPEWIFTQLCNENPLSKSRQRQYKTALSSHSPPANKPSASMLVFQYNLIFKEFKFFSIPMKIKFIDVLDLTNILNAM